MKKLIFLLILAISNITFSNCEADLSSAANMLLSKLNYGIRDNNDVMNSYNIITQNYNYVSSGSRTPSCEVNLNNHRILINKLNDVVNSINSQINNNFDGTKQIPYNPNLTYNGSEVGYEIRRGDIEDSTGRTFTTEKKETNTALDGTDHVGLVKYMYNIAGITMGSFNELELLDFASMTRYQLHPGVVLKPGDLIVMNYRNDGEIDTIGLVYQDKNGSLKMLEMGGNMEQDGSSVKSSIPYTDSKNTAYVVPFEVVMAKAFTITDDSDIRELSDIRDGVSNRSKLLNLPANNPNIKVYSSPRNQKYLSNNGFTSANITSAAFTELDEKTITNQIEGMTTGLFDTTVNGLVKVSSIIMVIMLFLITLNILWTILKKGLHGSMEEIIKTILSEIALKSPYFIFVVMYPVLMKNVVMPLFIYRLPTYLFGDFIKASGMTMSNGKYITYLDLMLHVIKKGIPLIIGSFGQGVINQQASISNIFNFFSTIWKVIGDWFSDPSAIVANSMETLGILFSIARVVMQTTFFRPLTATTGLMVILTLFGIVMNVVLSLVSFVISSSVGLFYMLFGFTDVTKEKAMNTLQIIISGFVQYLIHFAVIIVLGVVIELLGKASIGVIFTPFNIVNMIKVAACVSIIREITNQIGLTIASNF